MAVERLEFGADGMAYHAVTAAEHVSRYYFARTFCDGMRVLDMACGEGYGSQLLAQWGAKEVVGVDIAREAIRKARRIFAAKNVKYLVGDACDMEPEFLAGEKFDVICSFETIEHVGDVAALLKTIEAVRAPGGIVLISCPNDGLLPEGEANPHHKHVYSLGEFKALTEDALGRASAWFLGTPMQGYGVIPEPGSPEPGGIQMDAALDGRDGGDLWLLPQQAGIVADPDNVDFFLGVWGGSAPEVAVGALQSQTAFIEPWRAIDTLRPMVDDLKGCLAAAEAEGAAAAVRAQAELDRVKSDLGRAQAELARTSADLRRTAVVLAEERRANLNFRARAEITGQLAELKAQLKELRELIHHNIIQHGVGVRGEQLGEIAREVWWERNRRTLPYKVAKMFRRLAGASQRTAT
jgi:predicted RNA methylase